MTSYYKIYLRELVITLIMCTLTPIVKTLYTFMAPGNFFSGNFLTNSKNLKRKNLVTFFGLIGRGGV